MKEREPSSTAILIARATLLASEIPELRPLVPPGSASFCRRWLSHTESGFNWFAWSLQRPWARRGLFALQQFLACGLFLHFLARKQLLERWTREAIAAGCRQVVILGAGLDTLAWRLKPEFPGVGWFELDHPATQRLKRLKRPGGVEGERPAPRLEALDLRKEMPDTVLKSAPGFDPALPTFYLAEGLFMYLPEEVVREIITRLGRLSAPGSRLAFTFIEQSEGERLAFRHGHRLIDFWLRWRQEPFQWGIPTVGGDPTAPLEALASATGWTFGRSASSGDLRREIVAPAGLQEEPLAEGEALALFLKA